MSPAPYEGLELDSVNNPDTDTLALHSLKRLPGWSGEVRLEIRDGHYEGEYSTAPDAWRRPLKKFWCGKATAPINPMTSAVRNCIQRPISTPAFSTPCPIANAKT